MRYGAQAGFGIWVWKGQKRAAEPSPKGGFHCCLQPHFSGRKETRVEPFPKDGYKPGYLSQPLRILYQKNTLLNPLRRAVTAAVSFGNPLDF